MTKILLVDDDGQIRTLLNDFLSTFGMECTAVANGAAMADAMKNKSFDLLILDLMLPGEHGLKLCREVRTHSTIPIMMLTARSEPTDRVVGLEVGADDYIVKPFEPRELVARIQAILRRVKGEFEASADPNEVLKFSGWELNVVMRQLLSPEGVTVPLSNSEFRLLVVLVEHANRVLTREYLLDVARGRNMELYDRSIDIAISRLRQKLNDDPRTPKLIKTIRGEGYLLNSVVAR